MPNFFQKLYNKLDFVIFTKIYFFYFFIKNFILILYNYKNLINKKIFLAWHWSFGHQAQMLELVARKYKNDQKILLFEIIFPKRNNLYLSKLYESVFKNFFLYKSLNINKCRVNYETMKLILSFFINLKKNLITYEKINFEEQSKLGLHNQGKLYNFPTKAITKVETNFYIDDILKKYNFSHTFNDQLKIKCINFFNNNNIDIENKKILNIFFRDWQQSFEFYDLTRNFYKFENYIKTINYFTKNNYLVFLHHQKKITQIPIENMKYTYEVSELSKKFNFYLLNMYLYYYSDLQISQNSASQLLGSFLNKKIYCIDFFPFSIGLPGSSTNILFPDIKVNNKIIGINDYLNTDFFYAKDFDSIAKCVPTTPSQILNFVTSDLSHKKKYNEYLPNDSMIKKRNNNIYWCGDFN